MSNVSTDTTLSIDSDEENNDNEIAAEENSSSDWEHSVDTSDLDTTEDSNSDDDQEVINIKSILEIL